MHLTVNVITGFFLAHIGSFLWTPHLKCYLPKNQAYITYMWHVASLSKSSSSPRLVSVVWRRNDSITCTALFIMKLAARNMPISYCCWKEMVLNGDIHFVFKVLHWCHRSCKVKKMFGLITVCWMCWIYMSLLVAVPYMLPLKVSPHL